MSAVGNAQVQLGELKQGVSGVDFGPIDRGKGLLLQQGELEGWTSCPVLPSIILGTKYHWRRSCIREMRENWQPYAYEG